MYTPSWFDCTGMAGALACQLKLVPATPHTSWFDILVSLMINQSFPVEIKNKTKQKKDQKGPAAFKRSGRQSNWSLTWKGKPLCLVCGADVTIIEEYSTRWHYETKRQDKQQNLQKAEEMKRSLVSWQTVFTEATFQREAVVKASFIVAEAMAKSAWWQSEEEFLKWCIFKVCNPRQKVSILSTRNTVTDCLCEVATNLQKQLMEKGEDFAANSLPVTWLILPSSRSSRVELTPGELLGIKSMQWHN